MERKDSSLEISGSSTEEKYYDTIASDQVDGGITSCCKNQRVDEVDDEDELTDNLHRRFNEENVVSKTPIGSEYYSMNFKFAGYLIIFAHSYFTVAGLCDRPPRRAQEDIDMLKRTFSRLNFEIHDYKDRKLEEIKRIIKNAASMNFDAYASLAIAVSTHGARDGIAAYDAIYKLDKELLEPFKNNKSLFGKPKLNFIEACRGNSMDPGVKILSSVESDGGQLEQFTIPREADIMVVYSSVKDYISFHNDKHGSWFFHYLTEAFDKYSSTRDLATILTLANQKLSIEYESYNNYNDKYSNKKQCMCFMSTLTRLMAFHLTSASGNTASPL